MQTIPNYRQTAARAEAAADAVFATLCNVAEEVERRDALLAELAEEEYRRLLAAPTALDMREAIEWMGDAEAKVLAAAWSAGSDADLLRCARLGFALLSILQAMFRKAAEEAAIGRLDRMDTEAATPAQDH